jgi:hypothetical protein
MIFQSACATGSLDNDNVVEIRTDVAHSARLYDYFLGGKDNFPADRAAARAALAAFPHLRTAAQENRAFLRRATAFLARSGVRQFLDVGTGIPTSPNLHEIAQSIAAETRVVYVDNDPIVLAHARALLTSGGAGRTAYLQADVRDPARILHAAELADTLDLSEPVALSLVALLHFLPDSDGPHGLVAELLAGLPAGSYLMLSHVTADFARDEVGRLVATYQKAGIPAQARSRQEIARFFTGLELLDPGIVPCHRWHPEPATAPSALPDAAVSCYAAIGRRA